MHRYRITLPSCILRARTESVRAELRKWTDEDYWRRYAARTSPALPTPIQRTRVRIKRPESVIDKIRRLPTKFPTGLDPDSLYYDARRTRRTDHHLLSCSPSHGGRRDPDGTYTNASPDELRIAHARLSFDRCENADDRGVPPNLLRRAVLQSGLPVDFVEPQSATAGFMR